MKRSNTIAAFLLAASYAGPDSLWIREVNSI